MSGNAWSYPIIAKCRSCGASIGASSSDATSESSVRCGKCGAMNSIRLREIGGESRIKGEKFQLRRV
jgi:DNA-directed RNA polymerase subunit RPC12/RpoP